MAVLMYKRILVPLENTETDQAIVAHVRQLAKMSGGSVICMHVADGFAARNANQLTLRESEEMKVDREYLEKICAELERDGIDAECVLAGGDPGKEIAAAAAREGCDLIAMSTHGHRFIKDVIYGSVANEVRHLTRVPVLLVRGDREPVQADKAEKGK
ncbi:MAG TPA: universal stress protein [Gemmatimonadaceae bacterium]|nr:universal stress protein [Gemmatimonadaceae bacterium]